MSAIIEQVSSMEVITLRKVPRELSRLVRRKAAQERTSINKTVIKLLEESAGLRPPPGQGRQREDSLYHDLDALAGSWTSDEAAAFDERLRQQRAIEPDLWK